MCVKYLCECSAEIAQEKQKIYANLQKINNNNY